MHCCQKKRYHSFPPRKSAQLAVQLVMVTLGCSTWAYLVTVEHAHICPYLVTLEHFWLQLSNEHAHAKQPAPDHWDLFIASPSLLMCRRLYILTHADPCHACQLPHAPQEFGCLVAWLDTSTGKVTNTDTNTRTNTRTTHVTVVSYITCPEKSLDQVPDPILASPHWCQSFGASFKGAKIKDMGGLRFWDLSWEQFFLRARVFTCQCHACQLHHASLGVLHPQFSLLLSAQFMSQLNSWRLCWW